MGHEAVVRLLIEKDGIDINAEDEDGWTPLTLAVENGHEAIVQLLNSQLDVLARGLDAALARLSVGDATDLRG